MSHIQTLPTEIAERYTRRVALRHERLYGRGYQGPGSLEVFDILAGAIKISPGMRVLDVGCGLGGDCLRLVERHGVRVLGIDAGPEMISVAEERSLESGLDGMEFAVADIRTVDLSSLGSFDVVWTRDCGAFIPYAEKLDVWKRLYAAIRPGGQVLITDYCLGDDPGVSGFKKQMSEWGQHMIGIDDYAQMMRDAGFVDVVADNRTVHLLDSMLSGRRELIENRDAILADMSREEYEGLRSRWERKIGFAERCELTWMVLTARRAS